MGYGPSQGTGGGSSTGAGGGGSQTVWYFNSNVVSSAYAAGTPYVPLAKNATEQYVTFDLVAPSTGTLTMTLIYAMSAALSGDVALELDYKKSAVGDDPNAAITTQPSFTFTPGAVSTVLNKTHATFAIAVTAGDHLFVKITRKNVAGDTHTGTVNVLGVRPEVS